VTAPQLRALCGQLGCAAATLLLSAAAFAADPVRYADEDRDWGIPATYLLRQPPYHAPTPLEIPGARVVHTHELQAMLAGAERPVLVDVLSGEGHETLAGAVWLGGAGRGTELDDHVQADLEPLLLRLTAGDKARPLVFFCASSLCWLSYNAALRAIAAGHTRVLWYRGGIDAWVEANLPTGRSVAAR
jgi:PQQ-dependent catabolism-associated CXXCW motif protein